MSTTKGMLTLDQLTQKVANSEIETVIVAFTDLYGRYMGKRFDATFFIDNTVRDGTHACNYLLTVDMEMIVIEGYQFSNWEKGYGDFHLVPDMSTLRQLSWQETTALIICDVQDTATHSLVGQVPRSILRMQIDRAAELGYSVMAASELEYYLFENTYRELAEQGHHILKPAGWYIEDYHIFQGTRCENFHGACRKALNSSGVPVENSKGEAGVGQHELNIQYSDILGMADRHTIFKQCLKEVADQQNLSVTFMAKYVEDQSGSSCHIHLSLWQNGNNIFPGDSDLSGVKCSPEFKWFLGGWMKYISELMVFYAPTVNSYKRFQAESWAPTKIAWSYDNRTTGFRIVGHGQSLRIECRIPGADCNPYLVFAAALASGLDGIQNQINPPEMYLGDGYSADHLPSMPSNLGEAIQLLEKSDFARKTFGSEIIDHYLHFFKTELKLYNKAVTDWEKKRYFEQI
jgi:glutamine synthetase